MGVRSNDTVIGFIGIGVMGKSMARNLMKAGYAMHVYTRTKTKAQELIDEGAVWEETPASIAEKCNIIITIVGYPNDVEEVYFGDNGIINHARKGSFLIDMTTSKPDLAQKIEKRAKEKGVLALDAPVSGGDVGAREGKLAIMVGGEPEAFKQVLPVFEVMGENIVHQGEAGAGQHTKMCNQIAIASNMIGVCEALIYAERAGLEPEKVLKSIKTGAAGSWSLSNLAPRIIDEDFDPGFYVKHFIKDMMIAMDAAKEMDFDANGLALSLSLYKELAEKGGNDEGTQALYKVLQ